MTPSANKFLRMNPVIVLMMINHPRRKTRRIPGRPLGIFKQKLKLQKYIRNIRNTHSAF